MELDNKAVVITGANGNLGRAIAHAALNAGATVKLLDIAFGDDIATLFPERSSCHTINLFEQGSSAACFADLGAIDALVNAAGGFAMGSQVHETTDDDWSRMFDLNVRTMLNGVRGVTPGMIERRYGKIVNIGAAGALQGSALMAPYIAAKSAVIRSTECLAEELKQHGINVNCVLPSVIDTPQNRDAMPDADWDEWVTPTQLAETICFLISDAANGIHGSSIAVKNLA